jgi:hypothetical protein
MCLLIISVIFWRLSHYRRSHRAAATALSPSRCAPPPQHRRQAAANVALSRCCAVALLPSPCRRQAAADVLFRSAADVRFRAATDVRFRAAATAAAAALLPPRTAAATAAAAAAAAAAAPQFVGWLLRCRCILKAI